MNVWTWIVVVLWLGLCLLKAAQLPALLRARFREPLEPAAPDAVGGPSTVDVVVPARDEEDGLEACLASVLAQDVADLRVTVVDDRSRDGTSAVAERVAARDARVRALRVDELPQGWLGKAHALWVATRASEAEWLLFVDVDVTLAPEALRTALAEARRTGAQLVSVYPRLETPGFWEALVMPLCGVVLGAWFGAAEDPDSESAFANGQFLLIERAAYERIGGHRAVRGHLIEDVPLAQLAKRHGVTTRVAFGARLVSVRMYAGLRELSAGWVRIFIGALQRRWRLVTSAVTLALESLLPFVAAPLFALLAARGVREPWLAWWSACCALQLALVYLTAWHMWGLTRSSRRVVWLYPLSVVATLGILARAWRTMTSGDTVAWRGIGYRVDREGRIAG